MASFVRTTGVIVILSCVLLGIAVLFVISLNRDAFQDAIVAVDRRDFNLARANLRRLQKSGRPASEIAFLRGLIALRSGEPQRALGYFTKVDRNDLLRHQTLLHAGEAYYQMAEYADALRCFSVIAEESPENRVAHRWLAALYYDLGLTQSTAYHLQKLMEFSPDDFSPHLLMAEIYSDQEDFRLAADSYEQAMRRNPPKEMKADVVSGWVRVLVALQEFDGALKALETLDSGAAKDVMQAECYLGLGEIEKAETSLRQAELRGCTDIRIWICRTRASMQRDQYEEVISNATKVIEQKERLTEMYYLASLAARRLGRHVDADDLQRKSAEASKLSSRLVELTRTASVDPDDPQIREELAEISDQLGHRELARRWKAAAQACRKFAKK